MSMVRARVQLRRRESRARRPGVHENWALRLYLKVNAIRAILADANGQFAEGLLDEASKVRTAICGHTRMTAS